MLFKNQINNKNMFIISVVAQVVGFGAVTTLTATTLCSLLGQPRIYYQMAQDGLLFEPFGKVSAVSEIFYFYKKTNIYKIHIYR